jgi:hypothetical protein
MTSRVRGHVVLGQMPQGHNMCERSMAIACGVVLWIGGETATKEFFQ